MSDNEKNEWTTIPGSLAELIEGPDKDDKGKSDWVTNGFVRNHVPVAIKSTSCTIDTILTCINGAG